MLCLPFDCAVVCTGTGGAGAEEGSLGFAVVETGAAWVLKKQNKVGVSWNTMWMHWKGI